MLRLDTDTKTRLMRLAATPREESSSADEQLALDLENLASSGSGELEVVLPLILEGASRLGALKRVQRESRYELSARSVSTVTETERQSKCLLALLDILNSAGIEVVLLKGAAFRGTIYPEALRGASDLDLLVRKSDWKKTCALVDKMASRRSDRPNRRVSLLADYEMGFLLEGSFGSHLVEIHRGLTNPIIFSINESSLWERASNHPSFDGKALILSWEDNLLNLAVHRYRHLGIADHNVLDAHEIIARTCPDWVNLLERAEEWGARQALYFLLKDAAQLLGTPVPKEILESLEPTDFKRRVGEGLFDLADRWQLKHGQLTYRLAQLLGQTVIPDSRLRALSFQGYYAGLRLLDLADALFRFQSVP